MGLRRKFLKSHLGSRIVVHKLRKKAEESGDPVLMAIAENKEARHLARKAIRKTAGNKTVYKAVKKIIKSIQK